MKRPIHLVATKIMGLLVLGAAVNFAVAWRCAMWSQRGRAWEQLYKFDSSTSEILQCRIPKEWHQWPYNVNVQVIRVNCADSFGLRLLTLSLHEQDSLGGPGSQYCVLQSGWPMRGLEAKGLVRFRAVLPNSVTSVDWEGGLTAPDIVKPNAFSRSTFTSGIARPLPFRVMPREFAINTLFYAGVLWVLFLIPGALRRMIRRRRGQCAQCAYPIGQNQRCTECGASVMPNEALE